jgi:hypothetical protein
MAELKAAIPKEQSLSANAKRTASLIKESSMARQTVACSPILPFAFTELAMTTTKMRRFYFQIPAANVIECIWAHSLTDAKAKAALEWMPWWQQIEWLNPEHVTDPSIHV